MKRRWSKWCQDSQGNEQILEKSKTYSIMLVQYMCVCVCAYSVALLCLTLWDPVDYSPWGSSVHGISQARILEWVAISSSRGSSWPRNGTHVSCISCIGRWILVPLPHLGSPQYIHSSRQITLFYFSMKVQRKLLPFMRAFKSTHSPLDDI